MGATGEISAGADCNALSEKFAPDKLDVPAVCWQGVLTAYELFVALSSHYANQHFKEVCLNVIASGVAFREFAAPAGSE